MTTLTAVSPEGVPVTYIVNPLVDADGQLTIFVNTPGDEPVEIDFDSNSDGEIAFRVTTKKIESAA
jgi:hypothetical protein